MSEQDTSKEQAAPEQMALIKRSKPEFLEIGEGKTKRKVCSSGRFNTELCAQYILDQQGRTVGVGELAKVFYGANMPTTKEKIRRRLYAVFTYLLMEKNKVLVYEFDNSRSRISGAGIFDSNNPQHHKTARGRLSLMSKRFRVTGEQYEQALRLLPALTEGTAAEAA